MRQLLVPGLLVAAAVALLREAVTRDGVGPFEYAAVVLLVATLVWLALRLVRARWTSRGDARA